ncbi:MAG: CPBP family intramembrane metalloprotease [Alphaproteobacteria bacterium]|nr:CPBP family intramembrane metalloprotease [Alphaproteobacteria bacterium]
MMDSEAVDALAVDGSGAPTGGEPVAAAGLPSGPRLTFWDLALTVVAGGMCFLAALFGLKLALGPHRMAAMIKGGDPSALVLLFAVFFAVIVVAVWIGVVRHGPAASELLGLRPVARRWWWLAPLCVLLASVVLDEGVLRLLHAITGIDLTPQTSHVIAGLATSLPLALTTTVAIGLLGPFAEELLFRGLVFGYVEGRFGGRAAWATSSVLFAAAHIEPAHVALVLPIGILLGWVRLRSFSLWPCVVAHVVNNSIVVWAAYLLP